MRSPLLPLALLITLGLGSPQPVEAPQFEQHTAPSSRGFTDVYTGHDDTLDLVLSPPGTLETVILTFKTRWVASTAAENMSDEWVFVNVNDPRLVQPGQRLPGWNVNELKLFKDGAGEALILPFHNTPIPVVQQLLPPFDGTYDFDGDSGTRSASVEWTSSTTWILTGSRAQWFEGVGEFEFYNGFSLYSLRSETFPEDVPVQRGMSWVTTGTPRLEIVRVYL